MLAQRHGRYISNPAIKKAASRASSKARYISNPAIKKAASSAGSNLINSVAKKSTSYHLNKDIVPALVKGTGTHRLSLSLM